MTVIPQHLVPIWSKLNLPNPSHTHTHILVFLTHPVRTRVPVPRGQGLQGPAEVVRSQPGGLPSGEPGAFVCDRPAAAWPIGLPAAQPVGLQIVVQQKLVLGVLGDHGGSGRGQLLLGRAVGLLAGIHFWFLKDGGRGFRGKVEMQLRSKSNDLRHFHSNVKKQISKSKIWKVQRVNF